jgi:hypothetical protein
MFSLLVWPVSGCCKIAATFQWRPELKAFQAVIALFAIVFFAATAVAQSPSSQTPAGASQTPNSPAVGQQKLDSAKEKDIRHLLELSGSKKVMQSTMDSMATSIRPIMTKALPPGEYREKLVDLFFEKLKTQLDLDHFIDLAIPVYDKYYSATDIKELIKFYETPVGQKFASTMPKMSSELQELGQAWGKEKGGSIMREILAEHKDLAEALEAAAKAQSSH